MGERLADEVEILVVDALWRAVKREFCVAGGTALAIVELEPAHAQRRCFESLGVHHLEHCVHVAFLRLDGALAHRLAGNGIDALEQPVDVAHHEHGVGACVVE